MINPRNRAPSTALLLYDCLITFHEEVRHIWSRGRVGVTVLHAATRYSSLVNRLVIVLTLSRWREQSFKVRISSILLKCLRLPVSIDVSQVGRKTIGASIN